MRVRIGIGDVAGAAADPEGLVVQACQAAADGFARGRGSASRPYRPSIHLRQQPERGVTNLAPDPGGCTHGAAYLLSAEDGDRLDRTGGVHLGLYYRMPIPEEAP